MYPWIAIATFEKSEYCTKSRVGNLLICSFAQIAKIKWVTVSDSLRSLRTNERRWANHSGCSCQKSDHEQITQVTHDKWVTVSDSLRLLMINEWMSKSLVFSNQIAHLLFGSQKTNDSLKKIWLKSYFLVHFLYIKKNEWFAHFLFFNLQHPSHLFWMP